MPKAAKKFYAVATGRQKGVFETWDACLASVDRWPGAKYKSFPTRAEAESFVRHPVYKTGGGGGTTSTKDDDGAVAVKNASTTSGAKKSIGAGSGKTTKDAAVMTDEQRGRLFTSSGRLGSSRESIQAAESAAAGLTIELDTVMYADGSSLANGRAEARAGYGVYIVPSDHFLHIHGLATASSSDRHFKSYHDLIEPISRRLAGTVQTNNRGELQAIVASLARACEIDELVSPLGIRNMLSIRTDSTYSLEALLNWSRSWEKNGWKTKTGRAENRDLIERALALLKYRESQGHATYIKKVKGHSGDPGNDMADRLANDGAAMAGDDGAGLELYELVLERRAGR